MTPYIADADFTLYVGDVREVLATLPAESVDCCVTSPPYWGLRDYGADDQIGLESTPEEYLAQMVAVFAEVRRVLRARGTLWVNIGDSYARVGGDGGHGPNAQVGNTQGLRQRRMMKLPEATRGDRGLATNEPALAESWRVASGVLKPKDLVGIPWRVAFALQADGWYLRSDIIWHKPNPMPESVTDRPTKAHEYVFLLSKSQRYYYDADAIAEPATWYGPNGQPKSGPHANQMKGRAGKNESTGDRRKVGFNERWDAKDGEHPLTRNARSVWSIQTMQYAEAHFATFPEELPRRCILAGCPEGGTVLDPFMGSGTTAKVARDHNRRAIGIELNPEYAALCAKRNAQQTIFNAA